VEGAENKTLEKQTTDAHPKAATLAVVHTERVQCGQIFLFLGETWKIHMLLKILVSQTERTH
jgi:hypothetical protein